MNEPPSYLTGYATYQESLYPQLWRGLIRLWVPSLGNTGMRVANLAKSADTASTGRCDALLSANGMWGTTRNYQAPKGNGASGYLAATGHQLVRYSHEAWYVPVTTTTQAIIAIAESPGSGTHERSIFLNGSGVPSFYCWDGSSKIATGTTVAVSGRPIHMIATYDGSFGKIYVNGKYEGQIAAGNGYTSYGTPEFVMMYGMDGVNGSGSGNGYLLKAAVYNRPLSPAEIKLLGENPLELLKRKPRTIIGTQFSLQTAPPPSPPGPTNSELLLPNSDTSIGSHWTLGTGSLAYALLDEGDAHNSGVDTMTCTNLGTLGGELKIGFQLPTGSQNIARFVIHAYVTTNSGDLTGTFYVNGSVVPLANRTISPDSGGVGAWYTLDYSGTWFSGDITSLEMGFVLTNDFSSCILDSTYLTYGGTCPTNCSNSCKTYTIVGAGEFYNDTYTCVYTGSCQWGDIISYADRECLIYCDATNGWTIYFEDTNIDCFLTMSSGTFEPSPPVDRLAYTAHTLTGTGCYVKSLNQFELQGITVSQCPGGKMFMIL